MTLYELVRPDGLLAAAPLVLRYAPDRRRAAHDRVQVDLRSTCRTGLLSVGGSNRPDDDRPVPTMAVEPRDQFGAPGRIRTADHRVRSAVLYPAELRARAFLTGHSLVTPHSAALPLT